MPKYDFTWVTDAPIRRISKRAARSCAVRLKANVEDWIKEYEPAADRTAGLPTKAQIDGTLGMCDYTRDHVDDSTDMDGYVYEFCGAPVAIMVLGPSDGASTYVEALVTHPAAQFAGSIMIEYALNWAAKQGWKPVIELAGYDDNSVEAYRGLGFAPIPGKSSKSLRLEAEKAKAKWTTTPSGEWKYVSSRPMGPKYLKTTPPPPPPPPKKPPAQTNM